jgi:fatty-acyl-CoA synthase
LFILQEDGYGKNVGRIKDVIIRIGDKIFPIELEEFFQQHPDLQETQVNSSNFFKSMNDVPCGEV